VTARQAMLLARLRGARGMFVYGSTVRVARALESRGLVKLIDYGSLDGNGSNADGERWWVELCEEAKS
jgi:hypothetical protein